MAAGLAKTTGATPSSASATAANWEVMAKLAKEHKALPGRGADTIAGLAELTEKLVAAGVEDLVLDPVARGFQWFAGSLDPGPAGWR